MYGLLALKGVLMIVCVLVSIKEIVANRRLLPRGEIFLGPGQWCVLAVRVIESGVMDLCLHFLTVLLVGFYCDAIGVRIVIVC